MEIPSNKEIYAQAKKEAANIMTQEQIALNALFMLRKLYEENRKPVERLECSTCEGRDFK